MIKLSSWSELHLIKEKKSVTQLCSMVSEYTCKISYVNNMNKYSTQHVRQFQLYHLYLCLDMEKTSSAILCLIAVLFISLPLFIYFYLRCTPHIHTSVYNDFMR